jgi:molybdopterin-containing oxidoreductase family iron-sulfur binding subunit
MYPDAGIYFYAPLAVAGAGDAVGAALVPQYDVRAADVILAVDADFLASGPFHLRYAREFAERRRSESAPGGMNRLYALEPSVSVTGAAADHRLALKPSEVAAALERLLAAVSGRGTPRGAAPPGAAPSDDWLAALARDLRARAGRSLVVAGPHLSAREHALALAVNESLGNVGRTVWFTPSPLLGAGDRRHSIAALAEALRAGAVDTLVCLGGNPSYAAAGMLELPALVRRVRQSVYLGLYENETARDCGWMVPATHFLESWGDARAYDGTLSVVQPLIEPLYGGRTTGEVLSLLLGEPDARPYKLVRESWRRRGLAGAGGDFEDGWRTVLGRGVVEGSAFARQGAAVRPELLAPAGAPAASPIEVVFRPDARVHDGAFADNAWLQELPDPVTSLTWDNAAQVSPATARRLGVEDGDVLEVRSRGRAARLPALVVPGHADGTITVHFGYGREGAEAVARGAGANVYPLWPGDTFAVYGATVARVAGAPRHALALTQAHWRLEQSAAARSTTLDEYRRLEAAAPPRRRALTLYEPPASLPDPPSPHQWAMTIDLGACIGCGACVAACQAENNVPVVGRDDVLRSREMHWLRVDRYVLGPPDEPELVSQPMLCQHCEKAPCEYVCPVEATVHSSDGLNEMVYNRCVGTRFCSTNCPYQVRRFNWFDYNAHLAGPELMAKNPDVTVRERGVMEKCTFCVQRIREAEIAAGVEGRALRGDEVRTACQQACPANAIVFGSLAEPDTDVVRQRQSARAYAALGDLGTEPRVRYLMRVRNPNPELAGRR